VTLVLADHPGVPGRPPIAVFAPCEPDVGPYRGGVADLVSEIGQLGSTDRVAAEHILARRLGESQFAAVLSAAPDGRDATIARLLFDVRNYEPCARNGSTSLTGFVRISLLVQIDAMWWGRDRGYPTDADLIDSAELVDLDDLAEAGQLQFSYRHQADTLLSRAARSAERRALPSRSPRTAGMRLAMTRPRAVSWLNQLAEEFERRAPEGTPALWVTSLARSVAQQRRLAELGYVAPLPSAHCVGYAVDVEMTWYRRFHAHRLLRGLLLDHQRANEVNVIDEGQAWHICLRPQPGELVHHGVRVLVGSAHHQQA
jgi:hypothetical protein